MQRTNIYLDENQVKVLKLLAVEENSSVAELVRQAVGQYLSARLEQQGTWEDRWDTLIRDVRSHLPANVSSEEIELDSKAARVEAREIMDHESRN